MANGYLLAELLDAHGLLPAGSRVVDRENPSAKVQNLTSIQQPLLDLGVKFDSKIANELMTETKGTAVNMLYQMKLGIENAKAGGAKPVVRRGRAEPVLLGATLKEQRKLLAGHERMEAEHFEALVKQQVQDPKQLAQALSLSRYTEHMIEQQKRDEELDAIRARQYTEMVAARRQLQLAKLHEGKRLMSDWQEEGYQKHAANMNRRKDTEKAKLRFELSKRTTSASRLAAATAFAAADVQQGVDEFEATLRRLLSDGARRARRRSPPAPPPGMDIGAAEHLQKLEALLPSSKAMARGVRQAVAHEELRTRRRAGARAAAEGAARAGRRAGPARGQAARGLHLEQGPRQSQKEREIAEQLWVVRKEKEVMKQNRLLRDQQVAEAAKAAGSRGAADQQLGERAPSTPAPEREPRAPAERRGAARGAARQEHGDVREDREQLVALARAWWTARHHPALLPPKVMRDWLTLFKTACRSTRVEIDTPHVEELAPADEAEAAAPAEADRRLHEAELDLYLRPGAEWSVAPSPPPPSRRSGRHAAEAATLTSSDGPGARRRAGWCSS